VSVTQLPKAALGALALLLAGCDPEPSTACHHEGDEVLPDDLVAGTRVGDLLEPFFGEYQGTLTWETGDQTALTLAVPYEADAPYQLGNVWQCDAREVYYYSRTHITTDDGAFDNEVSMSLGRRLPNSFGDLNTVASFSAISDFEWQPSLGAKLGVNLERYSSSYLLFELDWPVTARAPTGGLLRLRGTLALDSKIQDTVQVATLSF
jgi:hypothetical protein